MPVLPTTLETEVDPAAPKRPTCAPIALAVADLHLMLSAPAARAGDTPWFDAMARSLNELCQLAKDFEIPVLCAGDIFHRYDPSPELINFTIQHLPRRMYAVPGQHDLPNHRMEDIKRSAYWTLCEAGVLNDLSDQHIPIPIIKNGVLKFMLSGFGWKQDITRPSNSKYLKIALLHEYRWVDGKGYTGADRKARVGGTFPFPGWDVVIIGDNHQSWDLSWPGGGYNTKSVWNCGGFMRTAADQKDHRPRVGVIYEDGRVWPHYLDTSKDKWSVIESTSVTNVELSDFINNVKKLHTNTIDFPMALRRAAEQAPEHIHMLVLAALDEYNGNT